MHLLHVRGPSKLGHPIAHIQVTEGFDTKILNYFFGDFLVFMALFSQDLGFESPFRFQLNR
jgi:hypothetical protein